MQSSGDFLGKEVEVSTMLENEYEGTLIIIDEGIGFIIKCENGQHMYFPMRNIQFIKEIKEEKE